MAYACSFCGEMFTCERNLTRHKESIHSNNHHKCEQCGKVLNRKDNYKRNIRSCEKSLTCPYSDEKKIKTSTERRLHIYKNHRDKLFRCENCTAEFISSTCRHRHNCKENIDKPSTSFSTSRNANQENTNEPSTSSSTQTSQTNGNGNQKSEYSCRTCKERFDCRRTLYLHQMNEHVQVGGGNLQPRPWSSGSAPWEEDGRRNKNLKTVYEANSSLILRRHQEGNVCSIYNFPINNNFSVSEIMQAANEIYDRQNRVFRLNLEFGFILVNTETGEYRYFKPHHNQEVFMRPIYISRREHLSTSPHKNQTKGDI